MAILRTNLFLASPLPALETASFPEAVLHHAMNPVSPEMAIIYPAAAERYFMSSGDFANVALSRRLLVENRISIAFDVLFNRSLFNFVDELQNAWIDRRRPRSQASPHQPEDYEEVANAFELAAKDAAEMSGAGPELLELVDLARSFREAAWTLETLQGWTVKAQTLLCSGDNPPEASLILLGARILWQSGIFRGAIMALQETLAVLGAKRSGADVLTDFAFYDSWRKEGFLRCASALALLLKPNAEIEQLDSALEELKEAIACFQRSRGPVPSILYKRLAETHETLGRTHFEKRDMRAAAYHLERARDMERFEEPNRLPVARALPRRTEKRRWLKAFRNWVGS